MPHLHVLAFLAELSYLQRGPLVPVLTVGSDTFLLHAQSLHLPLYPHTWTVCPALEGALGLSNIPPRHWGTAQGSLSSVLGRGRYLKNVCCVGDWTLHPFLHKSQCENWSWHTQIRSHRQGRTQKVVAPNIHELLGPWPWPGMPTPPGVSRGSPGLVPPTASRLASKDEALVLSYFPQVSGIECVMNAWYLQMEGVIFIKTRWNHHYRNNR